MTTPRQKRRTTVYTILLSVCLFLGVICACLLVALVLIGKSLALQKCLFSSQNSGNISEFVGNETDSEDSISVKITISENNTNEWSSGWRLPRDVVPLHYQLQFAPDLESGLFTGVNNITLQVKESRSHLVVNSQFLNVTKVSLMSSGGQEMEILDFHEDVVHQLQVVDLEDALTPGIYHLYFEFNGNMKNRSVGLYASTYKNSEGETRYIATSKLEPTYARQAFPCFDEPNYKAKYTVQIVKPIDKEYIALSNMNQIKEVEDPATNTTKVFFNTSVPMSTYLSCFIVCDFKYTEDSVKASVGHDVQLRVYATPAQLDKTKFALQMAKDCTAYYIDYFGIEYPLPKLDMIAIPDFVSGAMEHWGLVTYRETALLYDKHISSSTNQQRVATVVAHELAHMWFGNLVTLKWWNDLWLNEGFATYMQFKATDHALPDWLMMEQFLVDTVHDVLQTDATLSSHPIVQTVETPDQITEIFDQISYSKGASILRMLEHTVGEENFRKAISNYLTKYKYSNAITKNLLDEIQEIEKGFNVVGFMDTWTLQMGFPVVNISKNGDDYVLTQKRFLANPENENDQTVSPFGYKWTIPITYTTDKGDSNKLVWFDNSATEVKINVPGSKWVKFNNKQIGYYRVNYPKDMWQLLSENIKDMSISDKVHLLDDSFSIAKAGLLGYDVPLEMTKFLKDDDNYVLWNVASDHFRFLNKLLMNTPVIDKFQTYVRSLVSPVQQKFSWTEKEDDKHLTKLARSTVTSLACKMGDKQILDEASVLFNKWLNNNELLAQNTKATVYAYGIQKGTEDQWDKLFEKYKAETDAQEKIKLMGGLASIKNEKILRKLIDLANDDTIVRGQDYFSCLITISQNPLGTQIVWDYVRENWEKIVNRFTLNDRYLGRMVKSITSSFANKVRYNEMEDFFKRYPDAGAGATARKQALEDVVNNIKWLNSHMSHVEDWLNKNVN